MSFIRLLGCWLTMGGLGWLAVSATLAEDGTAKRSVIPFKILKTGHMTVEAKVNGKGPYTLIFDTGAPINLLNNKVAKDAELLKGKAVPFFTPFGAKGDVKLKKLEVGDGYATNVPAAIMDHPTVDIISKQLGPIEGIVGFPFFARYKMTLDYRDQTITLDPGTFQPPDVMKDMMKSLFGADGSGKGSTKVVGPGALLGIIPGENGLEGSGVAVARVVEGSPAAKAGILAGDRVLALHGRWTDTADELFMASSYLKPGVEITVAVKRAEKRLRLKATPVAGF